MIDAKRLSYWYGRVLALNDVEVSIGAGITGLVGPNGSGKTTFMRLAVGLLRPVTGGILVGGKSPWGDTSMTRRIGYSPESEIGFGHLTGRGLIRFALRMKGFSAIEAQSRTDEILERTRAAAFADKRISIMSRGMRQRVKLAAALVHDPEVLVLDEPLTGADPIARAEILQVIRDVAAKGRTVVMSTHVLHEVEDLTDQIVLLHRGRLLAKGRIAEIRTLIDKHPHEIRIVTPLVHALAASLAGEEDVSSMNKEPAALVVRTRTPASFYPKLTKIIVDRQIAVEEMTSPDDNLEAVFKYLTEK
jgi:ABC-2 type transport system ATP-binding protein